MICVLFPFCVKSPCRQYICDCRPNSFHVWFPSFRIGSCFPSQVEREVSSSCLCALRHAFSQSCPPRATEEEMLYRFACLATDTEIRFRCSDLAQIAVKPCHTRPKLGQDVGFFPLEPIVEDTGMPARQCRVYCLRVFAYPLRKDLLLSLHIYGQSDRG